MRIYKKAPQQQAIDIQSSTDVYKSGNFLADTMNRRSLMSLKAPRPMSHSRSRRDRGPVIGSWRLDCPIASLEHQSTATSMRTPGVHHTNTQRWQSHVRPCEPLVSVRISQELLIVRVNQSSQATLQLPQPPAPEFEGQAKQTLSLCRQNNISLAVLASLVCHDPVSTFLRRPPQARVCQGIPLTTSAKEPNNGYTSSLKDEHNFLCMYT